MGRADQISILAAKEKGKQYWKNDLLEVGETAEMCHKKTFVTNLREIEIYSPPHTTKNSSH